jgi:hypothetical protein
MTSLEKKIFLKTHAIFNVFSKITGFIRYFNIIIIETLKGPYKKETIY